jgi:hypothetical protein
MTGNLAYLKQYRCPNVYKTLDSINTPVIFETLSLIIITVLPVSFQSLIVKSYHISSWNREPLYYNYERYYCKNY